MCIIVLLPGYATASLRVTQIISSELRYDNNVMAESTNASDDFSLIISPQIELLNERTTTSFSVAYRPSATFYLRNPGINTINHSATLGIHYKASETTSFELNDRAAYTKESLDISLIGLQTTRRGILSNSLSLSMNHAFTSNLSTSITLSDSVLRFEDPASVDSRTDTASVALSYGVTPSTSTMANYSVTNYSFDTHTANATSEILTHSLMLGFTHHLTTSLDIDFSVGSSYTPSVDHYDWIANANIVKAFQASALSLGYQRATSNTMGLSNQLNINESYHLQFNKSLSDSTSIALSSTYTKNRTSPVATVDLHSLESRISGAWSPYSWMVVSAGYSHFKQWVNGSLGNDVSRDHVFISVTATTYDKVF